MDLQHSRDYYNITKEINNLLDRKKELAILQGKVADGMPKAQNQTSDPTANMIIKLEQIEEKIYSNICRLQVIQSEVETAIEALKGTERWLMRLRYYNGLTFRQIGQIMHYDKDYIFKLHCKIMAKLRAEYERKEKQ